MLTQESLAQFTGTATWYQHDLVRTITYTEGVKHVADEGKAHWLIDYIASMQLEPKIADKPFQVWRLMVDDVHQAIITCENGDGRNIYRDDFSYTDFPLPEITFWVTENVVLLPSEYSGIRIRLLQRASLSSHF